MMLSPYFPLAMLVATLVALLRGLIADAKGKTKLDGKAVVLPIVAVFAVAVCAWSQLRLDAPSVLDWRKVGVDAPIVFLLAAGGATFLQRLKDRSSLVLTGEVAEMKAAPAVLTPEDAKALSDAIGALSTIGKKPDTVRTYEIGISAVLDRNTAAAVSSVSGSPAAPPAPEVPPPPPAG